MTYTFKSGITKKGVPYVAYYNSDDCEESLKVGVLEDNNDYLAFRVKDSTNDNSVLVVATRGRDGAINLALQKDGNNLADTAWNNICRTISDVNEEIMILKIDNLDSNTIVEEL